MTKLLIFYLVIDTLTKLLIFLSKLLILLPNLLIFLTIASDFLPSGCPPYTFDCGARKSNGMSECIPIAQRCDGAPECTTENDEKNCPLFGKHFGYSPTTLVENIALLLSVCPSVRSFACYQYCLMRNSRYKSLSYVAMKVSMNTCQHIN